MVVERTVKYKRGKGWSQKIETMIVRSIIRGKRFKDTYVSYGPVTKKEVVK
jgi:hypothetical protein